MENFTDLFNLLRKIGKDQRTSQRKLAKELGFSLGKLNYCIKELQKKGLIKLKNFKKNKKKINYVYILTPQGLKEKTKLTINFMNRKMKEYNELHKELTNIRKND
tara:strand:+ start:1513 stop:1827 length:315 start_codon:yes stop_codon:yes gene_type:complete